jgi:hypothetical protein
MATLGIQCGMVTLYTPVPFCSLLVWTIYVQCKSFAISNWLRVEGSNGTGRCTSYCTELSSGTFDACVFHRRCGCVAVCISPHISYHDNSWLTSGRCRRHWCIWPTCSHFPISRSSVTGTLSGWYYRRVAAPADWLQGEKTCLTPLLPQSTNII